MLWIPATLGAAALQVARNALQRGLLVEAGPWGATLVRFLFGLPFSIAFAMIALALGPRTAPVFGGYFFLACAVGALAQIVATAAMLVSMRRSTFALGTVFQQSSIPLAALIGLALGEPLGALTWLGLFLVSGGMIALGWPKASLGVRDWSAGALGLVAGAGFAVSSNAFRQAALSLDPHHPVMSALLAVPVAQAMQSAVLGLWLAATDRASLRVIAARWRASLPAGFFGAAASGLWFTAFALSPAGPVRAVGVVEMPLAALAGRRLFAERFTLWQALAAAVIAVGVALAAFG